MRAGDPVHWKSATYNGVVCATLNGKARVQFIGTGHGPTWVEAHELNPGWINAAYWDVEAVKSRTEKRSSQ